MSKKRQRQKPNTIDELIFEASQEETTSQIFTEADFDFALAKVFSMLGDSTTEPESNKT